MTAPLKDFSGVVPCPLTETVATEVRRYEPERLDPRAVTASNRLFRRRSPLVLAIEGQALQLQVEPLLVDRESAATFTGPSTLDLVWAMADGPQAVLTLPRKVVARVLELVDPELAALPGAPTLSLIVELALAPLLDVLEPLVGTRLTLVETKATGSPGPAAGDHVLGFRGILAGVPWRALLWAACRDEAVVMWERVAGAVDARPVLSESAVLSEVPVPVEFRAGSMRLPTSLLSELRAGDVLVPEDFPFEHGRVVVVAGGRSAPALADASGVNLQTSLQPIRTIPTEFDMTEDGGFADRTGASADDSSFGDLEITLVFELGRCRIDLAELRSLAPGYVFPLASHPAGPVDIVANGRRIGRGEIVRVGETLGVRTTRLFGRE